MTRIHLALILGLSLIGIEAVSQLPGSLFRRISRVSNFEFAVYNDGMLWGSFDAINQYYTLGHWPRGTTHVGQADNAKGLIFLAKKNGRLHSSDADFVAWRNENPLLNTLQIVGNQMVPGRIGDPLAANDSLFSGAGWRYVDSPDYAVYSSMDFDSTGVDISGNNFNDWPVRLVDGQERYVPDPLERRIYPPVYLSDEDMFYVFKDTDTRADQFFQGVNGKSIPIGIEIHHKVLTWETGPARDIAVFQYEIINKSNALLDSCFIAFSPALKLTGITRPPYLIPPTRFRVFRTAQRNMVAEEPLSWPFWSSNWTATPHPPTIGYSLVGTPRGYQGNSLGLTIAFPLDSVLRYRDSAGQVRELRELTTTDSIVYRNITSPLSWNQVPTIYNTTAPLLLTGPFRMEPNQSTKYSIAFIFSDSLPHLLLMDDFIKRMYNSNFRLKLSGPPSPQLRAQPLNRAVKLTWDASAETAVDSLIPTTLGKPFFGYRLLRSATEEGTYTEIRRWGLDSLAHEFIDTGSDIGGLKNNVRYYYILLAYDQGAVKLKLEPMDSKAIKGVNWLEVIPSTGPSNQTSSSSDGQLASGTLGTLSGIRLVPTNTTNFNDLLSGRDLTLYLHASSNDIDYRMIATVTDSLGARVHNALIETGIKVHGDPASAGVKEATTRIEDIFGIGGADITLSYRFEQTADSFRVQEAMIESSHGADVPIYIRDSLNYLGVKTIGPHTGSEQDIYMTFIEERRDTLNSRPFVYLVPKFTDAITGTILKPDTHWTITSRGFFGTFNFQVTGNPNRYYLTDTLGFEVWEFGHELRIKGTSIALDFADRGRGHGKPGGSFLWGSGHRHGTRDFQVGDRIRLRWTGGFKGEYPDNALIQLTGADPGRAETTEEMLEKIRIVPNPYMVQHEAQRGTPQLYFNYLPDECTIRIYTLALDHVKTIYHKGGSREEWDLQTEGGQLVASQLLIAHIEAPNGATVTKKFVVVVGR